MCLKERSCRRKCVTKKVSFMMRSLFALFCCLACYSMVGQEVNRADWMLRLEDDRLVASLSLPGAHDAATGCGMRPISGFGRTQALTIGELWDAGVRVFDLRPAVRDSVLHIYHSFLPTNVSFAASIDTLRRKLKEHPGEFAIVLLRHEDESESAAERALWPELVGRSVGALGDMAARFHSMLTVGELRGKLLFLSRTAFADTDRGGIITGWNHSAQGTTEAAICANGNGQKARLQLQDYYAPTNSHRRSEKLDAAMRFVTLAQHAATGVWTMNFLSGYATTSPLLGGFATSAGYKRNAAWFHPLMIAHLSSSELPKRGSLGILFMDFAGIDVVSGTWTHWSPFKVEGKEIIDTIIEHNFRY